MMYLAIDYGKRRIGLAVGQMMPRGLGVLDGRLPIAELMERIKVICQEHEVERIVIGWPVRSQGESGTLAKEIDQFGQKLSEYISLPVVFEPEQFTSIEARRYLDERRGKIEKSDIDELSAVLLLEQYINHQS